MTFMLHCHILCANIKYARFLTIPLNTRHSYRWHLLHSTVKINLLFAQNRLSSTVLAQLKCCPKYPIPPVAVHFIHLLWNRLQFTLHSHEIIGKESELQCLLLLVNKNSKTRCIELHIIGEVKDTVSVSALYFIIVKKVFDCATPAICDVVFVATVGGFSCGVFTLLCQD